MTQRPRFGATGTPLLRADAVEVRHTDIGRITHVDLALLGDVAEAIGADIHLVALPGMVTDPARALVRVEAPVDESQAERIRAAYTVEHNRAFDHDPRFGLVVLGEIASRALSPAVNDPGTAIAVIEAGTRVLATMLRHEPNPDWAPPARVVVPPFAFRDLIEDLFRPISRDGDGTIEVGIRLQKALAALRAVDEGAGPDCEAEARDALDRAQAVYGSEQDRKTLTELHAALWPAT